MSDIVERLRIFGGGLCHEAADEIEELWAERQKHIDGLIQYEKAWTEERTKVIRLNAEIERLQEQLKLAVWSDSEECKMLTAENERLRVELRKAEIWISDAAEASER